MIGIKVIVLAATKAGRLYPRYDNEVEFLVVESHEPREWPYGIDIDGRIVFDVDVQRVLANFDVHIGRKRWQPGPELEWPGGVELGDLAFPEETLKQKSFHLPLSVRTNAARSVVRIEIGRKIPDRLVALSSNCIALVAENELAGFLIRGFSNERELPADPRNS